MNDQELVLAGMDVPEFMNRIMNNTSLVRILVKKFVEDQNFEALCAAVESGDMAAAQSASHTLKGMCGNMSLKELFGAFQQQMTLFRSGQTAEAVAMMDTITPLYTRALAHLNGFLQEG